VEERVCVFIDGSNLYHALRDTIGRTDLNFGEFAHKLAMGRPVFRVYYYNALQDPGRNAESARDQQEFLSLLNQTPYLEVRLGTLRVIGGVIVEKGVDVMLATDVVNYAYENMYDTAIIVSGDADYAYALQLVKNKGKHIEVAYFETNISRELQDIADNRHFLDRHYFEGLWTGHRISLRPAVTPVRTRSRTRRTEIPAAEAPVAAEEVAVVEAVAPPAAAPEPVGEAGAAGTTSSRRRRRRRGRGGSSGVMGADGTPSEGGDGAPEDQEPAAELGRDDEYVDVTAAMPATAEDAGEPESTGATPARRRRRRGRGGRGGGGGGAAGGPGETGPEGEMAAAAHDLGFADEPERVFDAPAAEMAAPADAAGEAAPARSPRRRAPARRTRTAGVGESGPSNDGVASVTAEAAPAAIVPAPPAPAAETTDGPAPRARTPRARRTPAATGESPATPRRRTRAAAAPVTPSPDTSN